MSEDTQEQELCGHVNRHSIGIDGKPDNLACTKPLGHAGNHGAMHHEKGKFGEMVGGDTVASVEEVPIDYKIAQTVDGREVAIPVMGYDAEFYREWGEMAGIPAGEIEPERPELTTIEYRPSIVGEDGIALSKTIES